MEESKEIDMKEEIRAKKWILKGKQERKEMMREKVQWKKKGNLGRWRERNSRIGKRSRFK